MRGYLFGLIAAVVLAAGGCPDADTGNLDTTTAGSTATGTTNSSTTGGANTTDTDSTTAGAGDDADRVLELVNAERTGRGLTELTRNSLLDAAAEAHAGDMAANDFFAHTGSDGGNVGDRATAAGYTWSRVGENIAFGQQSPEEVMDAWMNSDGHRANILNPDFTELGVGIDESGDPLWVQVFAAPA